MSKQRFRHSYYTQPGSPHRWIIDYLKGATGRSFQAEVDDLLIVHLYPYMLKKVGASPALVEDQVQASILRLRQAISALEVLASQARLESTVPLGVTAPLTTPVSEPITEEEEDSYLSPEDSF
ncbi:MAG: hypothetical protein HC810_04115 [Acaryochloridaceae cyanobacterium RL_2_7]|nr:hypothetical protein [Acaryochloridaceae cyanobacterium RL_2_7]